MTTGAPGGIIIPEVPATAPGRRCWRAAGSGVCARLGILWPASCGHPRCRARATYVHGLGHCEPPDGRRRSNSAPGCAVRLRAVRSSLADHIREKKKSFCCVTTRRRNLWTFNGLGCSLGPLTALAFYLGMPDFGLGILAVFGLSPRRLPAANLSPAFRLLAISLVPAPRLVLVATPFAHAAAVDAVDVFWPGIETFAYCGECPREARSPKGNARGECDSILLGQFQDANKTVNLQTNVFRAKKTKKKTDLAVRLGRRHEDRCRVS